MVWAGCYRNCRSRTAPRKPRLHLGQQLLAKQPVRTRRLNPGSVIKFRAREQITIAAAASSEEGHSDLRRNLICRKQRCARGTTANWEPTKQLADYDKALAQFQLVNGACTSIGKSAVAGPQPGTQLQEGR